ncbi:hypothetical protein LAJ19_16575 (plasmid) [Deinococcus taeanensis]|uniref:hypothetical protein n=1 Tax=Deinococcus taeanensis TaxID=2737050 RepID=UPI001CDBBB3A|nr:hypothetical protein [Deinococcus taeanensis]UBV44765.1 hypothetical protein LAJ19_16575 [Deinococcus taeanensis]
MPPPSATQHLLLAAAVLALSLAFIPATKLIALPVVLGLMAACCAVQVRAEWRAQLTAAAAFFAGLALVLSGLALWWLTRTTGG